MAANAPRASIVIPAHDEASVIGRCLDTILADARPGEFEIVVACNGCTDDTADIARTFADVTVVDVERPSKIAALNAADAIASTFPRIYLDADVSVDTNALRAVSSALQNGALAAAPRPLVDASESALVVRLYFAVWRRLGYATRNVVGSGVYGLSEAARSRFDHFPDLIADDGYVYSLFAPHERVNPSGAVFTVRAPRTARATLNRRERITLGNLQLQRTTGRTMQVPRPTWRDVLRREPWLLPAGVVFLTINHLASKRAQRRLARGDVGNWNRDHTTREIAA